MSVAIHLDGVRRDGETQSRLLARLGPCVSRSLGYTGPERTVSDRGGKLRDFVPSEFGLEFLSATMIPCSRSKAPRGEFANLRQKERNSRHDSMKKSNPRYPRLALHFGFGGHRVLDWRQRLQCKERSCLRNTAITGAGFNDFLAPASLARLRSACMHSAHDKLIEVHASGIYYERRLAPRSRVDSEKFAPIQDPRPQRRPRVIKRKRHLNVVPI